MGLKERIPYPARTICALCCTRNPGVRDLHRSRSAHQGGQGPHKLHFLSHAGMCTGVAEVDCSATSALFDDAERAARGATIRGRHRVADDALCPPRAPSGVARVSSLTLLGPRVIGLYSCLLSGARLCVRKHCCARHKAVETIHGKRHHSYACCGFTLGVYRGRSSQLRCARGSASRQCAYRVTSFCRLCVRINLHAGFAPSADSVVSGRHVTVPGQSRKKALRLAVLRACAEANLTRV